MSDLKVSIVIGAYNQQDFIHETLDTVLAQTYPHLEIIIADDGSTDDTPKILKEYQQRFPTKIKLALGGKNVGIPGSINRALALRTGELTAFLDGDDLMLSTKIEKQVALLQNHPEATGCYHDMGILESETGQVLGRMSELYNGSPKLFEGTLDKWFRPRNFFAPSSIMARTDACPAHGFDERLKHLSEVLFFVETFRTGKLLAIDEVLGQYRRHSQNVTSDPVVRAKMTEYELMVYAILEARYPDLYPLLKRLHISCLAAAAIQRRQTGDPIHARKILWNIARRGAVIKSLMIFGGLLIMGQKEISATISAQPYQRSGWINRFTRFILG